MTRRMLLSAAALCALSLGVAVAAPAEEGQTKPAASSEMVVTYYFMPG